MIFSRFEVRGGSMEPFLKGGDRLFASNFSKPKKGDVVIIRRGSKEIVKRVGHVKGDLFYVLGDNPGNSEDSRDFGFISRKEIIGKVLFKY